MLKKIIFLVLAIVLLASSIIPSSNADTASHSEYVSADGSIYMYETYGSGSETSPYESGIFGFTMGDSDTVKIQSSLEGYPVTHIADNSFRGTEIRSILIPERIRTIGTNAFAECDELADVYFLGDLPESFAEGAFPNHVTFHYISGKQGWPSYDGHTKEMMEISEVISSDGSVSRCVLIDSEAMVINGTPNDDGDMTIPKEANFSGSTYPVNALGSWAFYDRSDIVNVVMQQGISEISERAFYKCNSLITVDIPNTVVTINDEAFRECHNLNDITMQNVKFIGFEAFRMCYAFTSVTVPDSTVFIGEGAFRYCKTVTSMTLSQNIVELSPWVLDGCYLLESIEIPIGVLSIGDYAFHLCKSLEEITIPRNIGTIGDCAFMGCSSLADVYIEGDISEMGKDVFKNTSDDLKIHYENTNSELTTVMILLIIVTIIIISTYAIVRKKKSRE